MAAHVACLAHACAPHAGSPSRNRAHRNVHARQMVTAMPFISVITLAHGTLRAAMWAAPPAEPTCSLNQLNKVWHVWPGHQVVLVGTGRGRLSRQAPYHVPDHRSWWDLFSEPTCSLNQLDKVWHVWPIKLVGAVVSFLELFSSQAGSMRQTSIEIRGLNRGGSSQLVGLVL